RKINDTTLDESRLENKQRIRFSVSSQGLGQSDGIRVVVGYRGRAVERFGHALGRCSLRCLSRQCVLHDLVLAVRASYLLAKIGVLGDRHTLKLSDEH